MTEPEAGLSVERRAEIETRLAAHRLLSSDDGRLLLDALEAAEAGWVAFELAFYKANKACSAREDRIVELERERDEARAAVERVKALADEWEVTDWNATPHLGCLDMRRYCAGLMNEALDPTTLWLDVNEARDA